MDHPPSIPGIPGGHRRQTACRLVLISAAVLLVLWTVASVDRSSPSGSARPDEHRREESLLRTAERRMLSERNVNDPRTVELKIPSTFAVVTDYHAAVQSRRMSLGSKFARAASLLNTTVRGRDGLELSLSRSRQARAEEGRDACSGLVDSMIKSRQGVENH